MDVHYLAHKLFHLFPNGYFRSCFNDFSLGWVEIVIIAESDKFALLVIALH